jgi:hypothetical protein
MDTMKKPKARASKRGAPKKEAKREAAVSIRVEARVKAALVKAAAADRRTVSQFVEGLLVRHLEENKFLAPD